MILIRQRSTWVNGERSLEPCGADTVPLVFDDSVIGGSFFKPIVEAIHDVRLHTGLPPARLELWLEEWNRIRISRGFIDTLKYCGAARSGLPFNATPEDLAAMIGIEVRVHGLVSREEAKPQPPPKEMNCRNCGAPPKLGRYDCAHCGTRYADSGTPTRPYVKASGLSAAELADTLKTLGAAGYATLPVGAVVEFIRMPEPSMALDKKALA